MRWKLELRVVAAMQSARPFPEEARTDYVPYAKRFMKLFLEELHEGEMSDRLIYELVKRSFLPREIAHGAVGIVDIERIGRILIEEGFSSRDLRPKLM